MRRAARTDDNHSAIVGVLRAYGIRVLSLAGVGQGCPDLLVYNPRTTELLLLECKDGNKPPSKRKLTPMQEIFREQWPVAVVKDENEALEAVGIR